MSNPNHDGLDELINSFIKEWCGDSAPHLLDTDDNDGQRLREAIQAREQRLLKKLLEKKLYIIEKAVDEDGNAYPPGYKGSLFVPVSAIEKYLTEGKADD